MPAVEGDSSPYLVGLSHSPISVLKWGMWDGVYNSSGFTNPNRTAINAAWVRSFTPSFIKTSLT